MNKWVEIEKTLSPQSIVIGCNYHTKWQAHSSMRFVLKEVKDNKARLITRNTGRNFWTNIADLIFIMTNYNKQKAVRIILEAEKHIH